MKVFYLVCVMFISLGAIAQEIVVPSSFDENKMIVKRMDKSGNFLPVDENTLPVSDVPSAKPSQKAKHTKKLRAVETGYTLPKTTFGTGNDAMQLPSTFSVNTMSNEMQDVRRDHTTFQECSPNDKNCREYEIDEKGQVVF